MPVARPIRVAVVGGGCAAVAAAFELTRPEHEGRYAVTLYQQGWRLGGKGASGRGAAGRIEEHGLHVWMGWYENAFRLLRECYAELGRDWRAGFEPVPYVAVTDQTADGGWLPWVRALPPADGLPGDPATAAGRFTVARYLERAAGLVGSLVAELEPAAAPGPLAGGRPAADRLLDTVVGLARYGEIATLTGLAQAVAVLEVVLGTLGTYPNSPLLALVDAIGAAARRLLEARLARDRAVERVWEVIDLALATIRGSLRFRLFDDPRGFDAVDDYDCREWLLLNGASRRSVESGYLRALYDLSFAYEDGDPARPRVSAAQALRGFARAFFTYRGSFFWRLTAGMGDVVFAPFYEALRRRGVRFEFFHRLTNVRLADGEASVAALEFDVQATVRGSFEPLVDVRGLPCWPATPDWTQLEDGERLRQEGSRFECHWDRRRVAARVLHVGADFDLVVLGVGAGAIPHVAAELVQRDARWRASVAHVRTVATQAVQLWLRTSMESLGWPGPPVVLSGFAEPFDTWADMRHLIPRESWALEPPGALAYFCGVLPDGDLDPRDASYPERQRERVREHVVRFLGQDLRHLWPNAVDGSGRFRWELLVAPNGPPAADESALGAQHWTANVNPSDRYTLALPGSSAHRISPLDPGFDNLTVCGDWTACGYDMGCVEAAVISGRLASHALSARPALDDIVGYDHP
jgi:uncharacterized protein with NAD-binding domain and iron-sulfur cluster